jgi:hypothetical protein
MRIRIVLLPRAIRRELVRLEAPDLRLRNLGYGRAVLVREDGSFRLPGRARDILDRLQALPDGAGSDAVVAAFADDGVSER